MARRLNVLSRSYKTLTYLPVSDTARDAKGDYPTIIVTSWQELRFCGQVLRIESSPGETGRRKGLKIPR